MAGYRLTRRRATATRISNPNYHVEKASRHSTEDTLNTRKQVVVPLSYGRLVVPRSSPFVGRQLPKQPLLRVILPRRNVAIVLRPARIRDAPKAFCVLCGEK